MTVQPDFECTDGYPHTKPSLQIVLLYPDKLNEIVRNWKPGKFTKTFLCHLVELVHTTLKALEWYRSSKSSHLGGVDGSAGSRDPHGGQLKKDVLDLVADAKKFDFDHYFGQLATNK